MRPLCTLNGAPGHTSSAHQASLKGGWPGAPSDGPLTGRLLLEEGRVVSLQFLHELLWCDSQCQ
jgi:hypothetical protein